MIRSTLVTKLRQQSGNSYGVINRKDLMKFLGYRDRHSVDPYLYGVMRLGNGYSIEDVADRIIEVERNKSIERRDA